MSIFQKRLTPKKYQFKINIDTDAPTVDSKDLYFPKSFTFCTYPISRPGNTLYCLSQFGTAFSFTTITKKFIYAKLSLFDTRSLLLLHQAPFPLEAQKKSFVIGL